MAIPSIPLLIIVPPQPSTEDITGELQDRKSNGMPAPIQSACTAFDPLSQPTIDCNRLSIQAITSGISSSQQPVSQ